MRSFGTLDVDADICGVGMCIVGIEIEGQSLAVYFDDGSVAREPLTPEELKEIKDGSG